MINGVLLFSSETFMYTLRGQTNCECSVLFYDHENQTLTKLIILSYIAWMIGGLRKYSGGEHF